MRNVSIRNIVLGEGMPKIIVPVMGNDIASLVSEAEACQSFDFDITEWRADYFDNINTNKELIAAVNILRDILSAQPLLFTFRSKKEGGEQDMTLSEYMKLNKTAIDTGCIDLIDLELCTDEKELKECIKYAHDNNVKVIVSNHDFIATPPKEEIINRLKKMQDLGADISKIALTPTNSDDVLAVLNATNEMKAKYANTPIITVSMGKMGVISRLTGELFGSCATFGAAKLASAPGQIGVKDLRAMLNFFALS